MLVDKQSLPIEQAVRVATQYASTPCKSTTSSYLFARWHLFRHVGYLRHQQQVDLWPFDLESGVLVMCGVGYLCADFSLPKFRCSRLRPDVRDRQTDRRQTSDKIIAYNNKRLCFNSDYRGSYDNVLPVCKLLEWHRIWRWQWLWRGCRVVRRIRVSCSERASPPAAAPWHCLVPPLCCTLRCTGSDNHVFGLLDQMRGVPF